MVKFTKEDYVDVDSYEESINRLDYVYYDRPSAKFSLDFIQSRSQTFANRALFVMKLRSSGRFFTLDSNSVYRYLTQSEMCPEHYFWPKKSQTKPSLDKTKVLSKLVANGRAAEFLNLYMEHRSAKSKYGSLKSLVDACDQMVAKDNFGNDIYQIGFNAMRQKNLRFNYNQFDIISQIPKDISSIICADDGYFLAWGDFAQSDFRIAYNLFIRSAENDKIMNQYEDKYEALARIIHKQLGKNFDLDKFKEDRHLYKRMTLATVYGTRSSIVAEEQEFVKMFSEFLMECPRYAEYYNRLQEHMLMKSPILIKSYFGHEEYINNDIYETKNAVFDALNSPIQTGTSEIVILTVNSILQMARDCGLTEDQFGLYFTRHDEPVFRISKDAIDYLWILQEHSTVLVDDWSPLSMEFDYGYNYKIPDKELQQKAAAVCETHKDKITKLVPGTSLESEYFPIKPLLVLAFHWYVLEDAGVTIVVFRDERTNSAMFSIFETTDTESLIQNIRLKLKNAESQIQEKYTGVFVRNNYYSGEDFFGDTHVVYRQEVSGQMTTTVRMCKGMVNLYCRKNSLTVPEDCGEPLQAFPPKLDVLIVEESNND